MDTTSWRRLCGLAVQLCGSQAKFKTEANILKRLVQQFGPSETERFLRGAQLMRWTSLTSLGSADGLGRRMALSRYWQDYNKQPSQIESLAKSLKRMGLVS